MRIEFIHVKNYKIFKDIFIANIPNMAVFLGANGSGKSTLFDVSGFLHDALMDNVRAAITKRGGYKEVVSRGQKGPSQLTPD
ncbi:MAG: AAA family ATPase [Peptococcaceae bacterium]|nr:AAA family ATPase [Peptococcaceae bacterium]